MGDTCLSRFQEILLCSQPYAFHISGTWQAILSIKVQHILQKEPKKAHFQDNQKWPFHKSRKERLKLFIPVPSHLENSTCPWKYPDNQSKALKEECAQRYSTLLVRFKSRRGFFQAWTITTQLYLYNRCFNKSKTKFANIGGMPLGVRWFFRAQ